MVRLALVLAFLTRALWAVPGVDGTLTKFRTGDSREKREAAAELLRLRRADMLPEILKWWTTEGAGTPQEEDLFAKKLEPFAKDPALRQYVVSQKGEIPLSPDSPNTVRVVKMLLDQKVLPPSMPVVFAKDLSMLLGEVELSLSRLPNWVLEKNLSQLYPTVLRMRAGMGPSTDPTRMELSRAIAKKMETGAPQDRAAIADAVAGQLIRKSLETYTPVGRDPVNLMTLFINRVDRSDLDLAQGLLDKHPKMDQVEAVEFRGPGEKSSRPGYEKVNYPTVNNLYEKGPPLRELLADSQFRVEKDGTLVRGKQLLEQAQFVGDGIRGVPCDSSRFKQLTPSKELVPTAGK